MPDKYQSAVYFREHREEQRDNKSNYNENDPFCRSQFGETGRTISAMMHLPTLDWPADLFKATYESLHERLCACGCGKPHRNAVSRVVEGRSGNRILWYRTMSCRNSHKRML
jgi:hypothetical protein